MTPSSIVILIVVLSVFVLSATARASADDEKDQIVDPEELAHFALPPPENSSLFQGEDWEAWEASEDVKQHFHYFRSGCDEDGLVVYISENGKSKYREMYEKSQDKIDEFEKHHEQFILRAAADAVKNGNKGIVLIIDLDGFSMRNFASTKALKFALKSFISLVRLNGACKYGFLINVNFAAETFMNLAKPFLGDWLTKFETYGTRTETWKPKILRKIAPSQLPPALGGSKAWEPLPYPKGCFN